MSTDYEGVTAFILSESSITSLLSTYSGTSQPLVVVGTIPEGQTGLPAISIRNQIQTGQYGISETFIELHCYAETEPEARAVAQACYDYFRDSLGSINDYSAKFEATILPITPDIDANLTVVELKIDRR